MEYKDLRRIAKMLGAVSHPVRLDIMFILEEWGELLATNICFEVEISKSDLSRHLRVLEETGWIQHRREGREKYFSINSNGHFARFGEILKLLSN